MRKLPDTSRVPAIPVLPVPASTVNLLVLIAKSSVTLRVPAAVTLPEGSTANLSVKILKFPDKSKSPATPKSPSIFILEHVKLPEISAFPSTSKFPVTFKF